MAKGRTLRSIFVRLGFDVDARGLNKVDSQLSSITSTARRLAGILATIGATAAFIGPAANIEQARISLEVLTGSAEKANILLEELFELTQRTPFKFNELLRAATTLKSVGIEAERVIPTLEVLGNAAAVLPKATLVTLTDIFAQIKAGGRVFGQQVRRFRDNALPIADELGKKLGITAEEATNLMKGGTIAFKTMEELFFDMSSAGGIFFKGMEKQSKTFIGAGTVMADIMEILRAKIGEVLLPELEKLQQRFINFLQIERNAILIRGKGFFGVLAEGVRQFSKFVTPALNDIKSLTKVLGGLDTILRSVLFAILAFTSIKILSGLGRLATAMLFVGKASLLMKARLLLLPLLAGAAFLALGAIIADIAGFFTGKDSITGLLLDAFENKFPRAFNLLRETLNEFTEKFLIPLKDALVGIFEFDRNKIVSNLRLLGRNLKDAFVELGVELGKVFREAFVNVITGKDETEGLLTKGKRSGVSKFDLLRGFASGVAESLNLGTVVPQQFRLPTGLNAPNIGGGVTQNNNFTIQTAPGTTVEQAQDIANKFNSLTGKMLREANLQTAPSHQ